MLEPTLDAALGYLEYILDVLLGLYDEVKVDEMDLLKVGPLDWLVVK